MLVSLAQPAHAQANADLQDLIARQAALIADLQARVAALEKPQAPLAAPKTGDPTADTPSQSPVIDWSAGSPTFTLPDGTSFHVRGRIHTDASTTSGSRFDSRNLTGTELSSARLGVDGTLGSHLGYKIELDFADGAVSIKETYLSFETRLFGKQLQVFAGNKTGDRTIDGSSYDDFVPLFQRSMLATSIGPEKGIMGVGVLAKLAGKDWHLGLDAAGDNPNGNPGTASDTLTLSARATWTPQIADATRLHFGAWGYHERIAAGSITALTRSVYPGEHFNDTLLITMTPIIDPRTSTGEGAEIGLIHGPFWTFAEYGRRQIHAASEDRTWTASLAEAGLFLTGEHTNFAPGDGTWSLLRPRHTVLDGGPGAIEIMARYERVSLGKAALAGSGRDLTLGVNWYLTANVRVMADWVHWQVTEPLLPYAGSDSGDTFNLRFNTSF